MIRKASCQHQWKTSSGLRDKMKQNCISWSLIVSHTTKKHDLRLWGFFWWDFFICLFFCCLFGVFFGVFVCIFCFINTKSTFTKFWFSSSSSNCTLTVLQGRNRNHHHCYLSCLKKQENSKSPMSLFTMMLMCDDAKGPSPSYGILLKVFQYYLNSRIWYTAKKKNH